MKIKTAHSSGILMLLVYLFVSINIVTAADYDDSRLSYSDSELEVKIENLSGDIDFRYTAEVKKYIRTYTTNGKISANRIIGKVPVYFPVFEQKIRERNLPEELKVLAIVESHLKINAHSSAGAAGLWQLIKGTARMYNLTVRGNFDERYSVEKSTDAALEFLNDLYLQFDDWTLALAAYNCGPGNVRKAIRRSGGKRDFWEIKKYLPRETRRYIPKFIAISYLLKHYKEYGIIPEVPNKAYFETADARVYKHMSFKKISDVTGVSIDIIKKMNYEYKRNYIPVNTHGYKLTLPRNALFVLLENEGYKQIEFDKDNNYDYTKHIVDNFSREIASNLLGDKYRLRILSIAPINISYIFTRNYARRVKDLPILNRKVSKIFPFRKYEYYNLKAGESLMDIASRNNDFTLRDILQWNEISLTNPPRAGTRIRVSF